MLIPFGRNLTRKLPQIKATEFFDPREGRFKRLPAGYIPIDVVLLIDSVMGQIRECPSARVETVVLVNELHEVPLIAVFHKYGLPVVAVGNPLIENQDSNKVSRIGHSIKQSSWQRFHDSRDVAESNLSPAGAASQPVIIFNS